MHLYWITGLPGAGKTSVGRALCTLLRQQKPNVVFLDGDMVRVIQGAAPDAYSPEQRLHLALGYGRLCQALTNQGIDVVFATVSFFEEVWQWNRENIPAYHETYLKVDRETLFTRDQKGLYSGALKGEATNVVGVDLKLPEPSAPHLTLANNGDRSPADIAAEILAFFGNTQ